jgi:hypothetical protein
MTERIHLESCLLCEGKRIPSVAPHAPRWVLNAQGVRELRDCKGNLVPQSQPQPKEQ